MKYKIPAKEPCCSSPVTNKMNRMAYGKVAAKYTTFKNENRANVRIFVTLRRVRETTVAVEKQ